MSSHCDYGLDDWAAYAQDEVPAQLREEMEQHLTLCDECMELLTEAIELPPDTVADMDLHVNVNADKEPRNPAGDIHAAGQLGRDGAPAEAISRIRTHVMESLAMEASANATQRRKETSAWFRRPVFHYGLAASLTLVLYFSGVFNGIDRFQQQSEAHQNASGTMPDNQEQPAGGSWSDRMLNRTSYLLQELQERRYR